MASEIVDAWLAEKWIATIDGLDLQPEAFPALPHVPLCVKRGQAEAYYFTASDRGRWILKRFFAGTKPEVSYLLAIRDLVPQSSGTRAATSRNILTATSVTSLRGGTPLRMQELSAWIQSTVLMQKVPGLSWGDVADQIRSGGLNFSREERIQTALSLCLIVQALEDAGCAHRDLSSGNLFVDPQTATASLIDWDSVFHPKLQMPLNTPSGTPGYMAPFVSRLGNEGGGASSWCRNADRFALALLVVEILAMDLGSCFAEDGGLFDQNELNQRSGPGITGIIRRLPSDFDNVAIVLSLALASQSFAECPSPAKWIDTLHGVAKSVKTEHVFAPPHLPTESSTQSSYSHHQHSLHGKTIAVVLGAAFLIVLLSYASTWLPRNASQSSPNDSLSVSVMNSSVPQQAPPQAEVSEQSSVITITRMTAYLNGNDPSGPILGMGENLSLRSTRTIFPTITIDYSNADSIDTTLSLELYINGNLQQKNTLIINDRPTGELVSSFETIAQVPIFGHYEARVVSSRGTLSSFEFTLTEDSSDLPQIADQSPSDQSGPATTQTATADADSNGANSPAAQTSPPQAPFEPPVIQVVHKHAIGFCRGKLEFDRPRLTFVSLTDTHSFAFSREDIVAIRDDGIIDKSGKKWHFMVPGLAKGYIEHRLEEWYDAN